MATSLVVLAVFVVMTANTTILATVGLFGRAAGIGEIEVGIVISSSALLFVLTSSHWGGVSDRSGRRPVILWGLGGAVVSILLFAAVFAVEPGTAAASLVFAALLGARLLYGVLCGGVQPAGVAYMADVSSDTARTRGVAAIGFAVGLGGMAGPLLVAASVDRGFAVPALVSTALVLPVAFAALVFLRDSPGKAESPEHRRSASGNIGRLFLLAFAIHFAMAGLQATNAFYVQDLLRLGTIDALRYSSLLSATFAAGSLVAQLLAGRASARRPAALLQIGLAICFVACLACSVATGFVPLLVAFAAFGGGFALIQTGLLTVASLANGPDRQGWVAGQLHAAMAAAWIAGPVVGAALYNVWPVGPFALTAVATITGLLLVRPAMR